MDTNTNKNKNTLFIKRQDLEIQNKLKSVLEEVYEALSEKGYNPTAQIAGYILSGDPTYITSHKNARKLISKIKPDELLEELVKSYFK